MSPNGSMKTVVPSSACKAERRLSVPLNLHAAASISSWLSVPVRPCAPAARGLAPRMRDAAAAIRHATIANANAACRPAAERRCDQVREERAAGDVAAGARAVRQRVRAERCVRSGCSRGTRRTGSRPAAACGPRGGGGATPCADRPAVIECGSVAARPRIISVKKIPIDRTCAEFWKVWFMPPPAPRCCGGRLFITAARFGEANRPIETPFRNRIAANSGNGKSVGSRLEQHEAERRAEHPAGGEQPGAEAVGEVARGRAGEQHPERQRQHVDARPTAASPVKL